MVFNKAVHVVEVFHHNFVCREMPSMGDIFDFLKTQGLIDLYQISVDKTDDGYEMFSDLISGIVVSAPSYTEPLSGSVNRVNISVFSSSV